MLLIVTNRDDHTADWLIGELHRRSAPFVRFNTEDYPTKTSLSWGSTGATALRLNTGEVDLEAVSAVWYRRPVAPVLDASLNTGQRRWATGEAREALEGVWHNLDALWVNRPERNRVASSKMAQLRSAAKLGLTIPQSVVTNNAKTARSFVASQSSGAVVKPLSHGRLDLSDGEQLFFTSEIRADDEAAWASFGAAEPYLFQAKIAKYADVRVTVIGDRVFPVRLYSQEARDASLDCRRVSPELLRHEEMSLPPETEQACAALVADAGCKFGAIDLVETPEREFVFLENNPNGQWAWLEQRCGVPLRSAMADLLTP